MHRSTASLRALLTAAGAALLLTASPPEARACGGCFHPQGEVSGSVVTDHRMVLSVSQNETVLWDQVRYAGDPKEFAWVLPVREGAKVELSRDAWIAALDASTRTTVDGPERFCGGSGGGGGGGGCASSSVTLSAASDNGSSGGAEGAKFDSNGNVEVLSQSVIGPYQAVTIRATGGQGIADWLVTNGFAIPPSVRPTVDAYTRERFDFIALRLRPGQGVQAMRPVRVRTPGADSTMPLRMVAAGVGAKVGLTLWVLGEGRYRTQNFLEAPIDYDKLVWDGQTSRSNLTTLQLAALASNEGHVWITEASIKLDLRVGAVPTPRTSNVMNGAPTNPSLPAAYQQQCQGNAPKYVRCDEDELPPPDGKPADPADAGADASVDEDGGAPDSGADAEADAGRPPLPTEPCMKLVQACDAFDDLEVATQGLHATDVWITRLRADLPVAALDRDLRLEASPLQRELSPQHHTEKFSDPKFDPCGGRGSSAAPDDDEKGCVCQSTRPRSAPMSSFFLIGATAFAASRLLRRRRRV